jgi:hypothetical protein
MGSVGLRGNIHMFLICTMYLVLEDYSFLETSSMKPLTYSTIKKTNKKMPPQNLFRSDYWTEESKNTNTIIRIPVILI